MINIKNTLEISKEDTVLRYSEGDNVICVTIEGRIFIGSIDLMRQCEDKPAIRMNTSDINNPYQYSSAAIFIDDIEYMLEDNDANREIVIKLLWEQCEEKFINSLVKRKEFEKFLEKSIEI